jgi:hypothetical protein
MTRTTLGYLPPREVTLAPNLKIVFDQVPQTRPDGPFAHKLKILHRRGKDVGKIDLET